MQITQGQRLPLASIGISDRFNLAINIQTSNVIVIDFVCFGLMPTRSSQMIDTWFSSTSPRRQMTL